MKQVVPFKKDIIFKSKIAEITSISLEHSLQVDDDLVSGDFIISGDYKMTEASVNKEPFNYNLPFDIALDDRYDTSNIKVEIQDFYYEIINDDILRVNIEVLLDNLEEKSIRKQIEEEIEQEENTELEELSNDIEEIKNQLDERNNNLYDIEKLMDKSDVEEDNIERNNDDDKVEVIDMNEYEENEIPIMTAEENSNIDTNEIKSLFSNLSEEETFAQYHVYIMREEDTIDSVLTKYSVTKEILSQYNDIENIKLGDKIIIPSITND